MEDIIVETGVETVTGLGLKKAVIVGGAVVVTGLVLGMVYKTRKAKHEEAELDLLPTTGGTHENEVDSE